LAKWEQLNYVSRRIIQLNDLFYDAKLESRSPLLPVSVAQFFRGGTKYLFNEYLRLSAVDVIDLFTVPCA
jgi:hypothetical protein